MAYAFCAVIGIAYKPYIFFFHLFDVLVRYPVLLSVIKSVWNPRKQIGYTGLLFILLMYVFTLLAYVIFKDVYGEGFCDSVFICWVTAIDSSFKEDGALGGFTAPAYEAKPGNDSYILMKFFFDNLYFIVIMVIMINILAGIIIDTFGTLRQELDNYIDDLKNVCYICGFNSEFIEKNSKS